MLQSIENLKIFHQKSRRLLKSKTILVSTWLYSWCASHTNCIFCTRMPQKNASEKPFRIVLQNVYRRRVKRHGTAAASPQGGTFCCPASSGGSPSPVRAGGAGPGPLPCLPFPCTSPSARCHLPRHHWSERVCGSSRARESSECIFLQTDSPGILVGTF